MVAKPTSPTGVPRDQTSIEAWSCQSDRSFESGATDQVRETLDPANGEVGDEPRVVRGPGGDGSTESLVEPSAETLTEAELQPACDLGALSTDPLNCGACGYRCGSNAACEGGACVVVTPTDPGAPGTGLVAGAAVMSSSRYRMQASAGQAPGGNATYESTRYRLRGGLVGATQ